MSSVHPSATVGPDVKCDGAEIGPNCLIEGEVTIGAGTKLGPGCIVRGPVSIGKDNEFQGLCSLDSSQDKKREGVGGSLVIGDGNSVREFVTLHRATAAGNETVIGDGNLLMAYSHVAHDCVLGDGIVLSNLVQLGGEVAVSDKAVLGGGAMVHQRCRVGNLAMVGAGTIVRQDVPPYAKYAQTNLQTTVSINKIGLERAGMKDDIDELASAYRALYRKGLTLDKAVAEIKDMAAGNECLENLADFLEGVGASGLVRPRLKTQE